MVIYKYYIYQFHAGLFASSHMSYNIFANKSEEPTLVEMTEAAIEVLSKGDSGYYLFVEGGLIDWAHHSNMAHLALDEAVMLSKAVGRAAELTSPEDTLIVVTSDHSHTMTMNGYPHRGSDILGHPNVANIDKLPYSTLSYANGPSYKPRYNLIDDKTGTCYRGKGREVWILSFFFLSYSYPFLGLGITTNTSG